MSGAPPKRSKLRESFADQWEYLVDFARDSWLIVMVATAAVVLFTAFFCVVGWWIRSAMR